MTDIDNIKLLFNSVLCLSLFLIYTYFFRSAFSEAVGEHLRLQKWENLYLKTLAVLLS